MLLSPSSLHFARLLLGCPQGVSRASKQDQTCSEFRAVLCWILLNPTTIRFLPSFSSTSCLVCFHAQLNPYAGVFENGEEGEKVSPRRETRGKNYPWVGKQRPQGGKIGRSSENSSTLLRPHISSEKNNGYFLPRLSASVEMKTPRPEILRNENAASSDSFCHNARSVKNCS